MLERVVNFTRKPLRELLKFYNGSVHMTSPTLTQHIGYLTVTTLEIVHNSLMGASCSWPPELLYMKNQPAESPRLSPRKIL